jgi:hypothetical protein
MATVSNLRLRRLLVGNNVAGLTCSGVGAQRPFVGPRLQRLQRNHQGKPLIGEVIATLGVVDDMQGSQACLIGDT